MNYGHEVVKELTVTGYTMEQCRKIVGNYPVRMMALDHQDTDYPALLEIYRQYRYEEHSDLSMMAAAFALGRAIGIRDERAKRNGAKVVQPDQTVIDAADQAIRAEEKRRLDMKWNREFAKRLRDLDATGLSAILATMRAMAEGKPDNQAIEAGNEVLIG